MPTFCARCQREFPEDAQYCPSCGAPRTTTAGAQRRLMRSRSDARIAGVCGGLAEYFGVDVTLVRAAWLVFSIVPGAIVGGVIAYLLAWLIIPESDTVAPPRPVGRRLVRSASDRKVAGVCGGLAEYFGVDATPIRLLWVILSVICGVVVGGLIAYLVAWLIIPAEQPIALSSTPSPASPGMTPS